MICMNPGHPRIGPCDETCLEHFIEEVLDFKLYPWQKEAIKRKVWATSSRRVDL